MADSKSRKTGEQSAVLVKVMADAAAMREHIDGLEARILVLEATVAKLKKGAIEAGAPKVPRASKGPGPFGPPPLPHISGAMNAVKAGVARRSFVDITDVAELVESM